MFILDGILSLVFLLIEKRMMINDEYCNYTKNRQFVDKLLNCVVVFDWSWY